MGATAPTEIVSVAQNEFRSAVTTLQRPFYAENAQKCIFSQRFPDPVNGFEKAASWQKSYTKRGRAGEKARERPKSSPKVLFWGTQPNVE